MLQNRVYCAKVDFIVFSCNLDKANIQQPTLELYPEPLNKTTQTLASIGRQSFPFLHGFTMDTFKFPRSEPER
ncbi:hypothetical protein J6590_101009 [Homalodisca vitripennis]|nr:hypothetical protein J6590_101009 [Homalodisca vitripennis]